MDLEIQTITTEFVEADDDTDSEGLKKIAQEYLDKVGERGFVGRARVTVINPDTRVGEKVRATFEE